MTRAAGWTWDRALSGIVPPAISPLDLSREIDEGAIGHLVEHVLQGGCSGLFVLGGCGEGAWLPSRQRGIVVRAFARAVLDRRHPAVGVEPAVLGRVQAAERAAGVDPLVLETELADHPHHLLHVDRVVASPDFQHGLSPARLILSLL